jgi:flagellar biosynthesis protein FlhG
MGVVVNMASTRREGERTYETLLKACKGFLKIEPPLYGIVRRDARVRESIRYQTPLLARFPAADAAQDVEAVARRIIDG